MDYLLRLLRLRINALHAQSLFGPNLLDPLALLARLLPVPLHPFEPLGAEAAIHFALNVVTLAQGFPEKTSRMAFLEGVDDGLAVLVVSISSR